MSDDPSVASSRPVVDKLRSAVDERLDALIVQSEPRELYEPARYVLVGGGKRIRPILLILSAGTFGVPVDAALPAALAVEVFHNFTLVHDDIMDAADQRRGRPTVHVRWNQSTAILVGDYLLSLSYALLARSRPDRVTDLLTTYSQMVRRLCEGQTLDEAFEERADVTVAQYLDMIDAKTGALLAGCMEMGGILGGVDSDMRATLREIGRLVGRAFQIRDDLLDLVADDRRWGKTPGGDLIEGKRTYLLLKALELPAGDDREFFSEVIQNRGMDKELVEEARNRMERGGVLTEAAEAADRYTQAAIASLDHLPASESREDLRWLFSRLGARVH